MADLFNQAKQLLIGSNARVYLEAIVVLLCGVLVARLVARHLPGKRLHAHHRMVLRRVVSYLILGVTVSWTLRLLGVSASVLIGGAGILTVAVGFASQTSASNLISGLFLVGEKPFVIGDVIRVAETTGEVVSIDLLSVKLKTFDNLQVRIPNETMLKANVTNLTRYPVRRLDIQLGVAYKENIERVRETLAKVAERNPLCLENPKPLFIFLAFGNSSLDLQFSVWAVRENFLLLRNSIYEEIKLAFDAAGIEIPFPHRTLYTGSETAPFPVQLVGHPDTPSDGRRAVEPGAAGAE